MLGVFSGDCLIGKVGEPTIFKDFIGEDLFIGDIILCFHYDYNLGCTSYYMTVLCSNDYINYSNGVVVQKPDNEIEEPFILGIKEGNMAIENEEGELLSGWILQKIKDHRDIVDGEHWKGYGINYRNIDNLEIKTELENNSIPF